MSQLWTLKGRIVVNHQLPELHEAFGANNGVAGVTVKVSSRSRTLVGWGTWNSWGQMKTGDDGSFRFSETHNDDRRQFKVEILFDSGRLRIKEGQETSVSLDSHGFPLDVHFDLTDKDWHEVHNDDNGTASEDGRMAGMIDLGSVYTFSRARDHADLWFLYNKVFDLFSSYGADFAFKEKVVVKYPMSIAGNSQATSSYSNPLNKTIYIKEDQFFCRTMLHELMHIWEYERSTGEDSMAWQLVKHGDTHRDRESTTFVPSYEGFAEWATYKILKGITDDKVLNFREDWSYKFPDFPLTRAYIGKALNESERSVANVDYTERGWHSLFNILTHPMIDLCDFNQQASEDYEEFALVNPFPKMICPEVRIAFTFKEVLSIFLKHPSLEVEDYITKGEMNFRDFLDRAGAIFPRLDREKIKMVKTCLDPSSTRNPCP